MTSVNWNFTFHTVTSTSWTGQASSATATSTETTTVYNVVTSTSTVIPTTMSSATPAPTVTMVAHSGTSPAETIGIIVGVVAGACLFLGAIFFFCWKRKSKHFAKRDSHPAMGTIIAPPLHRERHHKSLEADPDQTRTSHPGVISQPSVWPESVHPDEVGMAVVPTEQHGFLKWKKNRRPSSRSYYSISAPIPIHRGSISETFQERFFKEPKPNSPTGQDDRHPSDATTIRTSGNPPTPNRTAINLLRLYSSTTSKSNSIADDDEDKERLIGDAPPMPTFTAVEVPLQPVTAKVSQDDSVEYNLEAGIRTNISKATSRYPLTPSYDNGMVDYWSATPLPPIPERHHDTPKQSQDPSFPNPASQPGNRVSRKPVSSEARSKFQLHQSPPPPYPEIPERSSSRQSFQPRNITSGSEGWPSQDDIVRRSQLGWDEIFQTATYPESSAEHAPSMAQVRNLTLPSIQTSMEGQPETGQPPSKGGEYPRKPLPPGAQTFNPSEDPLVGPSNYHSPSEPPPSARRGSSPTTGLTGLRLNTSYQYRPSRATLTPNKTPTGDLVLTVDM